MRRATLVLALPLAALLSACGGSDTEGENADDFAARVNGDQPAAGSAAGEEGTAPQTPATAAATRPGAAPGPYEAGTQTDPRSVSCGAPETAFALGQPYDDALGKKIAEAAPGPVRVVAPGTATTEDYIAQRLNVMIDTTKVVRDLRCG